MDRNPYQPPTPPQGYPPQPFGAPQGYPQPFGAPPFGAPAPFGAAQPFGSSAAGYSPQGQAEMQRVWAERDIATYAKFSVIGGAFSFIFFGILFGWLSVYRGSKALSLIERFDTGHEHATMAKVGRALGFGSIATWALGIVWLIFMSAG